MTAELEFIEPPRGGGTLADMMSADASRPDVTADTLFIAQAAAVREKSLARLAAAPASATVEMAVSFADVEKLDDVEDLVGDDLRLAWGAVRTREANDEWRPQMPGYGLGVPFEQTRYPGRRDADLHREQEAFAAKLTGWGVSNGAPPVIAGHLREVAGYVSKNGIQYVGAVVIGSPAAARRLALDPKVTAVCVGSIVAPWD
ncbi:MAG: anti sigma factor C-terminal domain-containing protein [Coriobacteriia bacterium]|nr:anti sigma factor C-terminal domain-containing protein [Coriobacteriia bacterium]